MPIVLCSLLVLSFALLAFHLSRFPRKSHSQFTLALLAGGISLLAGCGGSSTSSPGPGVTPLASGNWQISSSDAHASQLPALSGALISSGSHIAGVLHSNASASCIAPSQVIAVAGSANAHNTVTLTASGLKGGTLTITGALAADGKSLTNAAYNVSGGTCAFTAPAAAQAQDFSSITGNYAGSFSDPDGQVLSITASLTQTPASDTSGNFQLSGTGTFPSNPCFSSPVSISNSQVTGGSFTLTYADANTGNSVTASGTFSQDGTTLTVTHWVLTGSCGPDDGTGQLTRQ